MTTQGVSLTAFGRSDIGRVRGNNADAFVVADLMRPLPILAMPKPVRLRVGCRGILLAVSDGMGATEVSEVANYLTLEGLRLGMPEGEGRSAASALHAGVEKASQRVRREASDSGLMGMGATLTAVLIHGSRAYVAEVGDSRAYVLRGGHFLQLTGDQDLRRHPLDLEKMTPAEAETPEHENIILQATSTEANVVVERGHFTLRRRDRILLCSDGITTKLSNDEIRTVMLTIGSLDTACNQLIEYANARGGEDNITVILAQMDGEGLPELTGEGRVSLETVLALSG